MQWNLTSILIILFVFFLGYGIGLFEMHLRRKNKIGELDSALQRERARADQISSLPHPQIPAPSPNALRMWNDANGTLKMELDNEPVSTPANASPEQRHRLITLMTQLRPWTEGSSTAAAVDEVRPQPLPPPVLPVKQGKPAVDEIKPMPVLKSIVEQIDDILQANLKDSPYQSRDIHLTEKPVGIVVVKDGLKKYEGIDAVPDPEIRAFIRKAVSDWEKGPH